jgi:nicotinate-nucleotide pyrophosphorylase (carboxylating)
VLIKDNHPAALRGERPNPIAAAVTRARAQYPRLPIEVEAESLAQVAQALEAGADFILLDNMTPAQLRAAVSLVAGRARTEASGSITLATVREIAATGVDYVSVGALTHSARAVDLALDWA